MATLLTLTLCADLTGAQQPAARPLAVLRARGDVRVNQSLLSGDSTLFAGDRLRTGVDGVASISVAGQGSLLVEPGSTVSLPDQPQYLATLEQGKVTLRSLADARGFQVRVGNFTVVPSAPQASVTEITLVPGGGARLVCRAGSVGVLELDGPASLFLSAGESALILPDGTLRSQPQAPAPAPTPPQPQERRSRRGLLALLFLGAGAGGAVAALAGRGDEQQPVSPSRP